MLLSVLLPLLFSVSLSQLTTKNNSAVELDGVEVIYLETPSFLTKVQLLNNNQSLSVYGGQTFRTILVGEGIENFYATPFDLLKAYTFEFIDSYQWYYWDFLWTIGVEEVNYAFLDHGLYAPIVVIKPLPWYSQPVYDPTTDIDWNGIIVSSLVVNPTNMSDIIVYFLGWMVDFSTKSLSLSLITTHYWPDRIGFNFDREKDVVMILPDRFAYFSPTNRPQIHILYNMGEFGNSTWAVVADSLNDVMNILDLTTKDIWESELSISATNGYEYFNYIFEDSVVSKTYSMVYLAMSIYENDNNDTGIIITSAFVAGDGGSMYYLPEFALNPKVLIMDEPNNHLYVGLNDAGEILRMDPLYMNITGYQRLPEGIYPWKGINTPHYLIFTNYDFHSKVFRVHKDDFCEKRCPENGYCKRGKCVCSSGFTMSSNECQVAKHIDVKLKVSIGVSVALALIATIGWVIVFLLFRQKIYGYHKTQLVIHDDES